MRREEARDEPARGSFEPPLVAAAAFFLTVNNIFGLDCSFPTNLIHTFIRDSIKPIDEIEPIFKPVVRTCHVVTRFFYVMLPLI